MRRTALRKISIFWIGLIAKISLTSSTEGSRANQPGFVAFDVISVHSLVTAEAEE
jgi:hypothetical protein